LSEVAVIGAGVAGIQAALDLANHGIRVHLIDREPTIGGHMAQLDKTFPTNDCSMCILSPKMVDAERHPLITLHTLTEVQGIDGEVGNFSVHLLRHPRYINEERCNGCGDCTDICPVEVYNRFDAGIGVRKAIYKPHQQVVPNLVVRDHEHCIDCGLCYEVCDRDAVLHDDEDGDDEFSISVASIVVTTGYDIFNACGKPQLSYLRIPDVITSLELERLINASGPTAGKIKRLSDGREPDSIVFIQCVGSRDQTIDRPYCSCVCCMYAIKNAMLIREKNPHIEVTICYMDIRAFGKGYEEYYNRAEELGVRFLRGMPGDVLDTGGGMEMQVEDSETGEVLKLHPELVVLSVGLESALGTSALAERLGLSVDENGFYAAADEKMAPVRTLIPGIYIAGAASSPKDIPDSVAQGQAAAMQAYNDVLRSQEICEEA
jgi:heterodisulfide reductase subunit A